MVISKAHSTSIKQSSSYFLMTNYYIHLIDIKETTTHKGIGPQKKNRNSTLSTSQVYKGGFSMPVSRTLKKNVTYDY